VQKTKQNENRHISHLISKQLDDLDKSDTDRNKCQTKWLKLNNSTKFERKYKI
jgi:hypothetical protein